MGEPRVGRRDVLRLAAGTALLAGCGARQPRAADLRARGFEPLKLVFYTDVHAEPGETRQRALAAAAAAINAERADLVIGGGDYVADGFTRSADAMRRHWDAFMTMHDALRGERHVAVGNHDLLGALGPDRSGPPRDGRREFRARFGRSGTYYSFDRAGRHFILLDSIEVVGGSLEYRGWIDDAQLGWLERDLTAIAPSTPIVVVTHMPLVTAFYAATEGMTAAAPANRVVQNSREVLAVFARHRLQLVLQGHLHVHEEIRWRDTTFLTGGAVSGAWWRGAFHGTPPGFAVVTLHDDRVDCEYRAYEVRT
jgi:Icc protein